MEDDDPTPRALPRWVELEYKHMCTLAGPDSSVVFMHLSTAAAAALTTALPPAPAAAEEVPRTARAECHEQGVLALMQARGIARERVCLLDPKAPEALAPSDGDAGGFVWFLFGGILGDDPPRDRTAELRALGFPTRHLGPVQMTTDTALGVTKRVVVERIPLDEIPYVDYPTIRFNARESVEMPFRYMIALGTKDEPLLPPGMKAHLHADLDQSFDF
ncbi:SAM-dependent RNA methyltransferase [Lactarius vividus]|nr:SAM-dependent RNA methyltransferase [Lactarius vividus]